MSSFHVLSISTIKAPNEVASGDQKIDLIPWDLPFLSYGGNEKGYLYHNPTPLNISILIQSLKNSLSHALAIFSPLAGRLEITKYENNIVSCSILCNNEGAEFIHAKLDNTCIRDIIAPTYVPKFFESLFPLNGYVNHEGTTKPLFAVQVTELDDGIFIGFTFNHIVADGASSVQFGNLWAEISRDCYKKTCEGQTFDGYNHVMSKPATLERWFPNEFERPIRFPFTIEAPNKNNSLEEMSNPPERMFHFTEEKITKLKVKANSEANTNNISSTEAICVHLWRALIRSKNLDPQDEQSIVLIINLRSRMNPPVAEDYFGNAMTVTEVKMKVGELLGEGGLGKGACKMNKMVSLQTDEMLLKQYVSWSKAPMFFKNVNYSNYSLFAISGSTSWDVYNSDMGWGKPVTVRCGKSNKRGGKISMFAGVEKGSVDFEVCLPHDILEAMGNDTEFINASYH